MSEGLKVFSFADFGNDVQSVFLALPDQLEQHGVMMLASSQLIISFYLSD